MAAGLIYFCRVVNFGASLRFLSPYLFNNVALDPLAGCSLDCLNASQAGNLLRGLLLRLRLYYTNEEASAITDRIVKGAERAPVDDSEFIINEVLYELRKAAGQDRAYEAGLLNTWTAEIIKRYGEDEGLDFLNFIRAFRLIG